MTENSGKRPFRVIDGGVDTLADRSGRPEPVRNTIEHDGARMILRGHTEVWEITDPGAWADTPLCDLPPFVALVTLGLANKGGQLDPGEAADLIKGALERHGHLTARRARALSGIPRASSGFDGDFPERACIEFWWGRWWSGLAPAS